MKTRQGAHLRARSKRSRTRAAPRPTNISTKSEPEQERKGSFDSAAITLASSVFPVPGGPWRRMPAGTRAPSFAYFSWFLMMSITSRTSDLDSSIPATSSTEMVPWRFSRSARVPIEFSSFASTVPAKKPAMQTAPSMIHGFCISSPTTPLAEASCIAEKRVLVLIIRSISFGGALMICVRKILPPVSSFPSAPRSWKRHSSSSANLTSDTIPLETTS
mmetsp:Transcript_14242/g.31862  ORF Transcript_14242/g.31862 Transcript_14242/m.31862 type:complete len:218 (-) Transcript_14242:162-815(-)